MKMNAAPTAMSITAGAQYCRSKLEKVSIRGVKTADKSQATKLCVGAPALPEFGA
jgi:hypothetical protein